MLRRFCCVGRILTKAFITSDLAERFRQNPIVRPRDARPGAPGVEGMRLMHPRVFRSHYGVENFISTLSNVVVPALIGWFMSGTARYAWLGGIANRAYRNLTASASHSWMQILERGVYRDPGHPFFDAIGVFIFIGYLWPSPAACYPIQLQVLDAVSGIERRSEYDCSSGGTRDADYALPTSACGRELQRLSTRCR